MFEKGHTANANVPTGEVEHAVAVVDLVDAMAEEAVDSVAVAIETAILGTITSRIDSPGSDCVNRAGT